MAVLWWARGVDVFADLHAPHSVAGPARTVNEFCQLWAAKTGYKYTSHREQRVYGTQVRLETPSVRSSVHSLSSDTGDGHTGAASLPQ